MISLGITIFTIVCMWMIYEKLGLDGWKCLIPFYNSYVLYKRIYKASAFVVCLIATLVIMVASGWMVASALTGLIGAFSFPEISGSITVGNILIPVVLMTVAFIVLFVYEIIIHVKLAQAFGKGAAFAIGLIFLTPIFLGILAFDSRIQAVGADEEEPDKNEVSVQEPEEVYTESAAAPGNKICPNCKAEIPENETKCPYCRSDL